MSLQNFSLPYSSAGFFGVPETGSSPPVYFNDAPNAPPKIYGLPDERVRKPAYQPYRQPTYTRVTGSSDPRNGKTSVHAVVDYDDDFNDAEYNQENDYNDIQNSVKHYPLPTVTPIQGPIFLKNGSVPVVPLYSYPKINNGTFVQIPVRFHLVYLFLLRYNKNPPNTGEQTIRDIEARRLRPDSQH